MPRIRTLRTKKAEKTSQDFGRSCVSSPSRPESFVAPLICDLLSLVEAPEGWDDVAPQLEEFANQMQGPRCGMIDALQLFYCWTLL